MNKTRRSSIIFVTIFGLVFFGGCKSNDPIISIPNTSSSITDIDGNVYHSVTIGTQTWMVENLKTTKYKDGTAISNVTDAKAWGALTSPGYCWKNNDAATYKNTYGALYNWYVLNSAKLAPAGWHVATKAEWTTLDNYVSANLELSGSVAKALAATTIWASDTGTGSIGNNLTINNSSGFTALPSGYRSESGSFSGSRGCGWWVSLEDGPNYGLKMNLDLNYKNLYSSVDLKNCGYSVRCVKD